jgi:hypothetical protein
MRTHGSRVASAILLASVVSVALVTNSHEATAAPAQATPLTFTAATLPPLTFPTPSTPPCTTGESHKVCTEVGRHLLVHGAEILGAIGAFLAGVWLAVRKGWVRIFGGRPPA